MTKTLNLCMLMRLRMPTRWAPPRRLRRTAGCTLMGVSGKAVDVAVGGAHVMTIVRLGGRWSRLWLTAGLRLGGKLLRVRGQAGLPPSRGMPSTAVPPSTVITAASSAAC